MTPTKFLRPIVPLVKGWALSFLGWGMVGFVLGMNFVRNTGVPGRRRCMHRCATNYPGPCSRLYCSVLQCVIQ